MKRFEDWPSRLAAFVDESKTKPFAYGTWDCCIAVCDAIQVMTGKDPGALFRGQYSTALGATREMLEISGGGVERTAVVIAASFDMPEIPVLRAGRGDVVLVPVDEGDALGFVYLTGVSIAVAAQPKGLLYVPLCFGRRAWKVGA